MIDPELLKRVPCLADAPPAAVQDLARVARLVEYSAGDRVVPLNLLLLITATILIPILWPS